MVGNPVLSAPGENGHLGSVPLQGWMENACSRYFYNQDAPAINATPWGLGATWEAALDSQTWLIKQSVPSQPAGEGLLQRVEGLWKRKLWQMRAGFAGQRGPSRKTSLVKSSPSQRAGTEQKQREVQPLPLCFCRKPMTFSSTVVLSIFRVLPGSMELSSLMRTLNWSRRFFSDLLREAL